MKYVILASVAFFLPNFAHALSACSVKTIMNAENDYASCDVTVDGKTTNQKISEDAGVSFCSLNKAVEMNKNYRTFTHFGFDTNKKDEKKDAPPAASPAPPAVSSVPESPPQTE